MYALVLVVTACVLTSFAMEEDYEEIRDCPLSNGEVFCTERKKCNPMRTLPLFKCPNGRTCCIKDEYYLAHNTHMKDVEEVYTEIKINKITRAPGSFQGVVNRPIHGRNRDESERKPLKLDGAIVKQYENDGTTLIRYEIRRLNFNASFLNSSLSFTEGATNIVPQSKTSQPPNEFISSENKSNPANVNELATVNRVTISQWVKYMMENKYGIDLANLTASDDEPTYDCGDAEDRLRCKRKCPEHRIIRDRSCPFKRVCCLGRPSSIYSPLRELPFYKPPPEVAKAIQNNGYNYVINRYNTSYPIRIVLAEDGNKPEIIPTARTTPMSPTNIVESKLQKSRDRKSVKYCNKYAELTVDYLHAMPLQSVFLPFTLPMDDCLPRFTPLIVGGKNVSRGEYPHMAAVGYDKTDYIDYLCGGSLISEKFVLTAAHCIGTKWGKPVVVMLGSTELYSDEAIEVGVKRTFPYPGYELPSYDDDIALIELDREVKFSKYVRPACLPLPRTNTTKPGSVTIATGWGKTDFARAASLYLMKVLLEIRESVECEDWYKSEKRQGLLNHGINEKLICANGHESEYHDTCQGDSGGPLQQILPGHNCMYQIVAVTSFGKTCGTSIPGVYTKVEPYLDWIEGIVWPDDDT